MLNDCSQIQVTTEVYDFMFIHIANPAAEKRSLEYSIINNEGRLMRKGLVRGTVIQLRLTQLEEGAYKLLLRLMPDAELLNYSFTKHPQQTGDHSQFAF